MTEKKRKSSRS